MQCWHHDQSPAERDLPHTLARSFSSWPMSGLPGAQIIQVSEIEVQEPSWTNLLGVTVTSHVPGSGIQFPRNYESREVRFSTREEKLVDGEVQQRKRVESVRDLVKDKIYHGSHNARQQNGHIFLNLTYKLGLPRINLHRRTKGNKKTIQHSIKTQSNRPETHSSPTAA